MLNKDSKISCIITVCDRDEYINYAIKSILKQTHQPLEIIVVDNSIKKINIDSELINKIRLYNILPYAGIGQALNFGISLSNGEYLSFLEDDDYWTSNYLEEVNNNFKENYDYIVSPIYKSINDDISKYKNPKNKINLNCLLISNPGINISNLSVKKSSIFKVNGFETDLNNSTDKSLIIKFIINKYKGKVCEKIHSIKRFHSKNYTFQGNVLLKNFSVFYSKYKHLMSIKIKLIFLKKIIYYKFIK